MTSWFKTEYLVVAIAAAPIDGEANEALIKFFAKYFSVRQKDVVLLRGELSRNKHVKILGVQNKIVEDFKILVGSSSV